MQKKVNNIYKNIPSDIPEELFEIISEKDNIKIERIISDGHSTPDDYWYDQDKDEFVILLKGNAVLLFENDERVDLSEGDYVVIPKHCRHKVLSTSKETKTIWLAVHY
ncbi:MAG: cupin domain-containing protein [Melioribacteraceae bacterium]|nr:cupin domain-containing protein [Melioribacteraceae bacterium]